MTRQELIEEKLNKEFSPKFLQVENETHNHNVAADSESHYKVVIVSDVFNEQMLIKRHRQVNKCLADELQNGIHALAIHTFTQKEWEDQDAKDMASPKCHGGGK